MKSDIEIAKWVYHHIRKSGAMESLTGKLSDRGRPNGSISQDVVISVLANEGSGDIQQAYVNVNVYISDLWNDKTKAWERDTIKVKETCDSFKFLFSLIGDDYRVSSKDSSQKVMPNDVIYEDGHTEHIINNKLFIKINNE